MAQFVNILVTYVACVKSLLDSADLNETGDFPGGPVAKTPHSQCKGAPGLIPGQETRAHMPQLRIWCSQINK